MTSPACEGLSPHAAHVRRKARWLGLWRGGLLALLSWVGSSTSLAGAASREDGTCCSLAAAPSDTLKEVHDKNKRQPKLKIFSAEAQLLLATLSANPCDTLQEIEAENKGLRKLLKKFPWPKLACFAASGCQHSLPLRAERQRAVAEAGESQAGVLGRLLRRGWLRSLYVVSVRMQVAGVTVLRPGGNSHALPGGIRWEHHARTRWRGFGETVASVAGLRGLGPTSSQTLAPHSITKQPQLLIAARWPKTKSPEREDRRAELLALKKYDSAVAGPCSWTYFAGFFDAEGCVNQQKGGASLVLKWCKNIPECCGAFVIF